MNGRKIAASMAVVTAAMAVMPHNGREGFD